jgi:hypothetical protein
VVGDAYVEISPADPEYSRLAKQAVTQAELDVRRQRWQDEDEALRLEFEQYLGRLTEQGAVPPDASRGRGTGRD